MPIARFRVHQLFAFPTIQASGNHRDIVSGMQPANLSRTEREHVVYMPVYPCRCFAYREQGVRFFDYEPVKLPEPSGRSVAFCHLSAFRLFMPFSLVLSVMTGRMNPLVICCPRRKAGANERCVESFTGGVPPALPEQVSGFGGTNELLPEDCDSDSRSLGRCNAGSDERPPERGFCFGYVSHLTLCVFLRYANCTWPVRNLSPRPAGRGGAPRVENASHS